jgi:hypothetical protein
MSRRLIIAVGTFFVALGAMRTVACAQAYDLPMESDDEAAFGQSPETPRLSSGAATLTADQVERTAYYDEAPADESGEWPGCSDACAVRPTAPRFWASAEYLLWGNEGMYVPALVTTSPTGTPSGDAGVLGEPTTTILKGQSHFNDDVRSGGRFELGAWFGPDQTDGLSLSYFFIGQGSAGYHVNPADNDIIARPFFNVSTGLPDSRLIAYPGVVEGTVDIAATGSFQAAAVEYRRRAIQSGRFKIDFLFGYLFAKVDESVAIRDTSLSLSGVTQGTRIDLYDAFDSSNSFHGALFGIAAREELGELWTGDVFAKGALGGVASRTQISGETATTVNNVTTANAGGLLTQTSNLGTHRDGYVSSAWELGLKLRRRLTTNTSLAVGYSWFLLSHVERAGEQIDLGVNVTQIPPGNLVGAARPEFPGEKSSFWTQGLTFGLEGRF